MPERMGFWGDVNCKKSESRLKNHTFTDLTFSFSSTVKIKIIVKIPTKEGFVSIDSG